MKNLSFTILLIAFYACSPSQADNAGSEEIARISHAEADITKVGTVTANYGSFDLELISNGRLEARRRALVPFKVQEQIVNVVVQEGQSVAAGQILGKLEPFTYQKRLNDATNSYEQSLIDLEDRLLGFGYSLSDTASVPDNILKMARIRSGYKNAQSALTEARRNLSQTTITAPISGVISNLEAHEQNPSSAFPHFCEVLDINTMHLVFHLLETEIAQVQTEQQVEIFPFALTGEIFKGTVTSMNPSVDDKGMVSITATVPNPGRRLMDGMNARVLLKNKISNTLIVPKEAVLYRQNRQVVFIYEEGKAIWKYVETSHENSTHVAIIDGLEAGMEVIVENNLNLAHESLVSVVNEQ